MMPQEYIVIRGARENNLKNVTLRIPKRKITVFTGVSGSGKSSIVFDTIGAEAQRLLSETFTAFIRNRMPKHKQPEADSIENISPAMVIDQKRLGGNARSTVGTITDIYALLRLLYSRVGTPFVGYSHVFSFNDPAGMCPECQGIGKKIELDVSKIIDPSKSLNEGAILFPVFSVGSWYLKTYTLSGLFDNDKKLADYSDQERELLLYGKGDWIIDLGPEGGSRGGQVIFEGTPRQMLDAAHSITYVKTFFMFTALFMIFAAPVAFLTPLQVARSFGDEYWRLTAIEMTFSVGMMAGGILMAFWGGFKNKIHTMVLSNLTIGICTFALGVIPVFWLYLIVMGMIGIAMLGSKVLIEAGKPAAAAE